MTNQEALFRTWGAYLKYPQCCIDDFVKRVNEGCGIPDYIEESPFLYSGFIPCQCCHGETKDMSVEEASLWLGHNPFNDEGECLYEHALSHASTNSFKFIAYCFNLQYQDYIDFLERSVKRIHGEHV